MVREFANGEIAPLVEEAERTETFPVQVLPMLGELGLLGIVFPEEYGGIGADKITECVFVELYGQRLRRHHRLGQRPRRPGRLPDLQVRHRRPAREYLPRSIAGEIIGAYAITEPNTGSDAAGLAARAEQKNGGYVINGRKNFITNGTICDYCLVAAYTDKSKRGEGISVFIIDRETPGFEVTRKLEKMGHRSSDTAELLFEDCEVGEEALLGGKEGAFGALMEALITGRVSHGVKSAAIAEAAFDAARQYATEREAFGRSLSKFQAIRFKLADMATRIEAAKSLAYKAALALLDRPALCEGGLDGQVLLGRGRRLRLPRGGPDPRRLRLRGRVPGRALLPRRQAGLDHRGHQRDPAADHQQGARAVSPAAEGAPHDMVSATPAGLHDALAYPFFQSVFDHKSRRMGLGMEMPGTLQYTSPYEPVPLTELEEALLLVAGTGLTGLNLGDIDPSMGADAMVQWTARTWPSSCSNHGTELFFTNDEGTWFLDMWNLMPEQGEISTLQGKPSRPRWSGS